MNKLSPERRAHVIRALVEGNSVRATCRMTGVAKGTVLKLLADVGEVCRDYQDKHMVNLYARRIQCDEIWSFCQAKEKNVAPENKGKFGHGDVWTWTAIDADSKLVLSWALGGREAYTALAFMQDVKRRLAQRVQLTTDGAKVYLDAVERTFGNDIDYAMLVKVYGSDSEQEKRYSPAKCVGTDTEPITGNPDPKHVSTSYVERQNLTMRMSMPRFTRLTNAFSKKVQNLGHAVALHFMYYNFCRRHQTLGMTPAEAAGLIDEPMTIDDIVGLLEEAEGSNWPTTVARSQRKGIGVSEPA